MNALPKGERIAASTRVSGEKRETVGEWLLSWSSLSKALLKWRCLRALIVSIQAVCLGLLCCRNEVREWREGRKIIRG